MDSKIQEFMQAKRLAIVGVSHNPQKFGTAAYIELRTRGLEVYGVNPTLDTVAGDKCYASLAEVTDKVDGVVICVVPQKAITVLREAASLGMQKIWLQQGSQSIETKKVADELGVHPIVGRCILMYAGEVKSLHAFHRVFAKLFGGY